MDYRPAFRRQPRSAELTHRPSPEALSLARAHHGQGSAKGLKVKGPAAVRREARLRIQQAGGDPKCWQLVLGESKLQFGQYQGQTFRWLLSHDVGYACGILASHEKEREGGDTCKSPLTTNKDALSSYVQLFPEVAAALQLPQIREGSQSVRGLDQVPVGFGLRAKQSHQSLYESASSEDESYLRWVRKQKVVEGSRLHTLQMYVLDRDQEVEAGTEAAQQASSSAACGDRAEPADAALLAAASEIESRLTRDPPSAPPASPRAAVPQPPPRTEDEPTQLAATTGAQLLPKGWRRTLPEEQQEWLGRALFTRGAGGQPVLTTDLRLWWYPPGDRPLYTQPPDSAHAFFQCRFFLWMPYRMWAYRLVCPVCGRKLTGAGLYKTVRRVLDMSGWYFMGTEYLECISCVRKYSSWAQDILKQLDLAHRERFPAILTYKLSCDRAVIGQMKERTLGNSASRLRSVLLEQHTRDWMERSMTYLSVLRKLRVPGAGQGRQVSLPPMHPVPSVSWLLSVYVRDALTRLDETKARITSIFGDILKMVSTKKMTKKLAGIAAGSAACVTNVGNEDGQVLMSVLTAAEGHGLLAMADGLVRRYRDARKAPPRVLYVDRDCCSVVGQCKTLAMFSEWEQLVVRLDVWHIMRRFSRGVTTNNHPLFGLFMSRLSFAMFEWDRGDVDRLREAKQSEEGKDRDAHVQLSSREMARHCRRRTRGLEETERLVQEVLDSFRGATDTMGVLLIDCDRMEEIWSTQRRHLRCIQDPPEVALYTKTGEVTRGGVKLPVFRCARGSSSLESFNLHLCRFIPGTSASALHFQVYLLEGLVRWNENRARAAMVEAQRTTLRCYSSQLQHSFNQLTQEFLGKTLVENYTCPGEYTGELIGIEYLFSQTGAALQADLGQNLHALDVAEEVEEEWEEEEDNDVGFMDLRFADNLSTLLQVPQHRPQPAAVVPAAATTSISTQSDPAEPPNEEEEGDDVMGPDGDGEYPYSVRPNHTPVELRHEAFAAADTDAADTDAAAPAAAAPPAVPRSTAWQRKLREEQRRQAQEKGAAMRARRQNFQHFLCKRCGQPKTKQFGHSRYRAEHFCAQTEGRSVEEWLAEKRSQDLKKTP